MNTDMIERVEINGRRWYRHPSQSIMMPSSSSVLDILFPSAIGFIPEDKLAMGTLCHNEIAHAMVSLVHRTIYQPNTDPEVAKRIASGLMWLADSKMEILAVESPVPYLGIGMTPDLLTGVDKKYHVVDWKFAESVDERYRYQLELYMRAEGADSGTIVQINRKGEVFPHPMLQDPERFELIKSAINVRHHLDRKVKRYGK